MFGVHYVWRIIMIIFYFYITIFTLYFIFLAIASARPVKKARDKYTQKDSNLCVVVYASGECDMLENLVKQLKSQTYQAINYTIYVILDKVENPPEFIFQTDLDINLININNMEPVGKSQAYSILAEKLSEVSNLDAYVFMDANNYVDDNFLKNVNFYLTKYSVFIPMINYIGEYKDLKFWDCVKVTYSKYISKFLYNTRTSLGLTNLINTNAFVIKHDLLNKIGSFDFKDIISEMRYTLRLASEKINISYVDDLKVYRPLEKFDLRIPSISKRFGMFWNNIAGSKNLLSSEYLLSLLAPSGLGFITIYVILISHSYHFPFTISYTTILITAITLALAFCLTLFNACIYSKEYLYLFAYPIYSMWHVLNNFPPIRFVKNIILKKNQKRNVEKMITNVIVTDGKNDFPCKIELISENGLSKVRFINKKKTYITKNNHLRMVDALKELTQKLDDFGLSLKVCQACKYFQPVVDGSTNMVKGVCECRFEGRVDGDIIPTLIWNTCPKFEKQNVVNLF